MIDVLLNAGIVALDALSLVTPRGRFNFRRTLSSDDGSFFLGLERRRKTPFLEILVSTRLGRGREHYRLTTEEYATFFTDRASAHAFAEECRRGVHDARRFIPRRHSQR